jgi:hypothetical protein
MPVTFPACLNQRCFRAVRPVLLLLPLGPGMSGCLTPMALDRVVMAYNDTITEVVNQQILVNIARAKHHHPLHFTAVSSIAATYNFNFNAGAAPAQTGNSLLAPFFGGSVSENPTISIVPIEGEEFTKRLLTPIQETKLTLLLRQGVDIDMALRLMAQEFRVHYQGQDIVYANRPTDRIGYPFFRRMVLHLSSIQDRNHLYVEPLIYTQSWTIPAATMSPEGFSTLEKDYQIEFDRQNGVYHLIRKVIGRTVITNYDPDDLPEDERIRLNQEMSIAHQNEIIVDIRKGYPGGEFPVHGALRLRSFNSILDFIGKSMGEEPEYPVTPDPRTPPVTENPVHALEIMESRTLPEDTHIAVQYNDFYYYPHPERGYQWNREAMRLLYQNYQMTVTELRGFGTPSITIAK